MTTLQSLCPGMHLCEQGPRQLSSQATNGPYCTTKLPSMDHKNGPNCCSPNAHDLCTVTLQHIPSRADASISHPGLGAGLGHSRGEGVPARSARSCMPCFTENADSHHKTYQVCLTGENRCHAESSPQPVPSPLPTAIEQTTPNFVAENRNASLPSPVLQVPHVLADR